MVGSRLSVPTKIMVPTILTRWGGALENEDHLHEGKYIVEEIKDVDGEAVARLVDGDWNGGEITFKSSKHGHLIACEVLSKLINSGLIVLE